MAAARVRVECSFSYVTSAQHTKVPRHTQSFFRSVTFSHVGDDGYAYSRTLCVAKIRRRSRMGVARIKNWGWPKKDERSDHITFITLRANCGAVYCDRPCLFVRLFVGLLPR